MKLFIWRSKQHGREHICVMAESLEIALSRIYRLNICNPKLWTLEKYLETFYDYDFCSKDNVVFFKND